MKIRRLDEKTVMLEDLEPFSIGLLQQISVCADPGDSVAAQERLYPTPTHGDDPEMDEEWKEYVEPEMRRLFSSAVDIVKNDLDRIKPGGTVLELPVDNLEAWLHALNQARLALSARHGFTEEDMVKEFPLDGSPRSFSLFQVHFYGLIQEFFLRQLE